jgi:hypothetical protein
LSNPKEKPEFEEKADLSTDREQGLSNNFEDPALEDLLPALGTDPSSPTIIEEAAAAVEELVLEVAPDEGAFAIEPFEQVPEPAKAGTLDLPDACPMHMPIEAGLDVSMEVNDLLAQSASVAAEAVVAARGQMAELFLDLVAADRSFNDLVDHALSILIQATGAEAGSILELDHEKREFFFRASRGGGDPEKVKAFRVPYNQGIVGYVAETREPLYLRDMETDRRQLLAISMSTGLDTKSGLAAPILVGGQLFGVVELFNKMPNSLFEEADFETLKKGAGMLAKVLEVRFLMAELFRKAG